MTEKCSKCGSFSTNNNGKCSNCGAELFYSGSHHGQSQVVLYPKLLKSGSNPPRYKTRIGLIALSVFGGAESLLYAAGKNFNPFFGSLNKFASSLIPAFLSNYMTYFVGISGILFLLATFGYFRNTAWAWKIGLGAAILGVLGILSPNLLGALAGLISLGLLFKSYLRQI